MPSPNVETLKGNLSKLRAEKPLALAKEATRRKRKAARKTLRLRKKDTVLAATVLAALDDNVKVAKERKSLGLGEASLWSGSLAWLYGKPTSRISSLGCMGCGAEL